MLDKFFQNYVIYVCILKVEANISLRPVKKLYILKEMAIA